MVIASECDCKGENCRSSLKCGPKYQEKTKFKVQHIIMLAWPKLLSHVSLFMLYQGGASPRSTSQVWFKPASIIVSILYAHLSSDPEDPAGQHHVQVPETCPCQLDVRQKQHSHCFFLEEKATHKEDNDIVSCQILKEFWFKWVIVAMKQQIRLKIWYCITFKSLYEPCRQRSLFISTGAIWTQIFPSFLVLQNFQFPSA